MHIGRKAPRGAHEASSPAVSADPGKAIKQASGEAEDALRMWKRKVAQARKDPDHSHREYERSVIRAKKALDQARKPVAVGVPGVGGVKLFEDSVIVNGKTFLLAPDVSATVDTAGNLSRTRRYTATRVALLGPFSLFAPKGVKHDDRELFLLIEGRGWAELVQCNADAQARTRSFAQAINTAARNVHQARQAREQRVAIAQQALISASADQSDIHASEAALRGAADERNRIYATATSLSAILRSYPESDGRRVNSAHATLSAVHAVLQEEVPIPPRPAPPMGAG